MAQEHDLRQSVNISFGVFLLIIFAGYCLYPGNVDWICDQPLLIAKALEANRANRWGELGIAGGNGTVYGPVPNFIYQVFLRITHDLLNVVIIKVIFSFVLVLVGLLRISRDLKLRKEGILGAFISPFIFFYTRSLWDNVFLIPISAIYCSAIIGYCTQRRMCDFVLAVASGYLLFHIHLMSLIVLIPGMAILNFIGIKKEKKGLVFLLFVQTVFGVMSFPYLKTLLQSKTLASYGHSQWFAILFSPLLGTRLFGYFGFFEYFSPNFLPNIPIALKILVFGLIFCSTIGPLYFLLGLKRLISDRLILPRAVRGFFVSVLVMTLLISLKMGLKAHPHYMNASWPVYFCILWKVYSDQVAERKRFFPWNAYAISMVSLLLIWGGYIESNSGDRGLHFGPTLKNQIEIAKQLPTQNTMDKITIEVENFSNFPQRLTVLAALYGKEETFSQQRRLVYSRQAPSAEIKLISDDESK